MVKRKKRSRNRKIHRLKENAIKTEREREGTGRERKLNSDGIVSQQEWSGHGEKISEEAVRRRPNPWFTLKFTYSFDPHLIPFKIWKQS